jgi:hypothetical protein
MGKGEKGKGEGEKGNGERLIRILIIFLIPNAQCPIPDAQFPMPNSRSPIPVPFYCSGCNASFLPEYKKADKSWESIRNLKSKIQNPKSDDLRTFFLEKVVIL